MDYLVAQKDAILQLLNKEMYYEALICLDLVCDLWESEGYGYKYREISERITQETLERV